MLFSKFSWCTMLRLWLIRVGRWIFAFTIMAVLFVASTVIGLPSAFGKEIAFRRGVVVDGDQERAPLLEDN